ncbi:MAG: SpoVR family protein [Candidatus Yanofskybacteria bacterium]|nr:SpoVR family protein [Candidatus Yanofskybacteria bacterium]
MELLGQEAKKIMEECKTRARAEGLNFEGETLEYIATNQDFLTLSPKAMIPTLYDFWVDDVEVIKNKWAYKLYPNNPYETVINTRPPLSFYNDNNADWLNIMIFYHVLPHIDYFQNNVFFRNTWNRDFCGEALADKRLINRIREEMGTEKRWVDYVIEFARGADNLVAYYQELEEGDRIQTKGIAGSFSKKVDFYFGKFLKQRYEGKNVTLKFYYDELERLNVCHKQFGQKIGDDIFFNEPAFRSKFPELDSVFKKHEEKKKPKTKDILQYLADHSEFVNKEGNGWMKEVLEVVRRTSLFFQAQMRTHNSNEGWASLWHERLFIADPRIRSHEIDFSITNSGVVVDPKIGLNPYIGFKRLYEFIEELAMKGKLSYQYQLIKDAEARKRFDQKLGEETGKKALFEARKNFDDFMLVNFLSDEDFQDFVDKHNLFVAGFHLNLERLSLEVYIKSRSGKDYRKMLNDSLYHPPHITISEDKAKEGELYLDHSFEGRSLVTPYIPAVLIGLSYLAGNTVKLETTEFDSGPIRLGSLLLEAGYTPEYKKLRVLYTCKDKTVEKTLISEEEGGV